MARDHRLDFSDYKPSTNSTFRLDRDRSRSPKRPRSDSWRPSNSAENENAHYNGRRKRGKAIPRTENEYRERLPNNSREVRPRETHAKSRPRKKPHKDGGETKGLSDRIHSLRRLLEKATDMPADIRQEKERELQGYLTDQQRVKAAREKNAVTSRYHFVRFLERKKADRHLKKLEKNLDRAMMETQASVLSQPSTGTPDGADEGEKKDIMYGAPSPHVVSGAERLALQKEDYQRRLHEARVDLNYTVYAPLDQKYISLYPSTPKEGKDQDHKDWDKVAHDLGNVLKDDEAGILRNDHGLKPPLWYEVEKAMENDTLEVLRDGKVLKGDNSAAQPHRFRSKAESADGREVPGIESASVQEDQDDDSEDDFFER
jgi:rRNA-processing protein Efg1